MDRINSTVLPFLSATQSENITLISDESQETSDDRFQAWHIIYLVTYAIIIIFGSIGNVLTFIVMRKGSMKDVSTCLYMSILALADTVEELTVLAFIQL